MRADVNAPVCEIDFYSDETIGDPVSAYHEMLQIGPIVWLDRHQIYAIAGHAELTESLRNHSVFCSGMGVSINEDVNKLLVGSTLNSDPPAHDTTRAITFRPLTPKALNDVRARVEKTARALVDEVIEQTQIDVSVDLAPKLPLAVVRDLIGLGEHGKENMLAWAAATFELMGDPRDREDGARKRMKELRTFLEDPDTINALTEHGLARRAINIGLEQGIDPAKANELMRDYIAPSLDTTIAAIGYGIKLFAENPEQWIRLREDRSHMRNAIEEIVRLNTPIRAFSRFVAETVDVAGTEISEGSRALMVFGAANRDARKFQDPDRFDITRDTRGHVGFGHGIHACLGMHLARMEMHCLFNALADKVERFELAGVPLVAKNASIHACRSLPVRIVRCV